MDAGLYCSRDPKKNRILRTYQDSLLPSGLTLGTGVCQAMQEVANLAFPAQVSVMGFRI